MSLGGYYSRRIEREREWVLHNSSLIVNRLRSAMAMLPQDQSALPMISAIVANRFGVNVDDIRGESVWWIDVAARQIAMTLSYLITACPLREISDYFNRADHSVILYSYRKYGGDLRVLCSEGNLRVFKRISNIKTYVDGKRSYQLGGPHSRIWKKRRLAESLDALAGFKDSPAYSDDIFPGTKPQSRVSRLTNLRRLGYATSFYEGTRADVPMLWQITDAGLKARAELQHLIPRKLKEAA